MAKEAIVAADPKKKRLRSQILVIVILAAVYVICHFLTGGRLFGLLFENVLEQLKLFSFPRNNHNYYKCNRNSTKLPIKLYRLQP